MNWKAKIYAGLTFEDNSGKEVVLWRLASLSRLSKAKFKSPCNFEESPCRTHIFATFHLWNCLYRVYWNLSYPLSILKVIFLKSDPFRFKETIILVNNIVQREMLTEATFKQTNFDFFFFLISVTLNLSSHILYVHICEGWPFKIF